jgi:hypothetical protein
LIASSGLRLPVGGEEKTENDNRDSIVDRYACTSILLSVAVPQGTQ